MTAVLEYLREFHLWSVLIRLLAAAVLGGLIGLERGRKRRAAGFRTYMLVCMGSAASMILSQFLNHMIQTQWASALEAMGLVLTTDVARFGAQCINGIGFLGAGTIVVTGTNQVKGLTTAAGLWASACMGLAIGVGFFEAAVPAGLLILLAITWFSRLENFVVSKARNMDILVEFDHIDDLGRIIRVLKNEQVRIFDAEVHKSGLATNRPSAVFSVKLNKDYRHHSQIVTLIAKLDCVHSVEEI